MKRLYMFIMIGIVLLSLVTAGVLLTADKVVPKDVKDELNKIGLTDYSESEMVCNDENCIVTLFKHKIVEKVIQVKSVVPNEIDNGIVISNITIFSNVTINVTEGIINTQIVIRRYYENCEFEVDECIKVYYTEEELIKMKDEKIDEKLYAIADAIKQRESEETIIGSKKDITITEEKVGVKK